LIFQLSSLPDNRRALLGEFCQKAGSGRLVSLLSDLDAELQSTGEEELLIGLLGQVKKLSEKVTEAFSDLLSLRSVKNQKGFSEAPAAVDFLMEGGKDFG
jgi:hypothetical protein